MDNYSTLCTCLNILSSLITGLISGCISSYIIYRLTKKRDEKYRLYYYWQDFLFKTMEKNEIYFPSEQIRALSKIGKKDSRWYNSINEILDIINPYENEEREFSEEETRLAENVLIALEELNKWAKKNKLKI